MCRFSPISRVYPLSLLWFGLLTIGLLPTPAATAAEIPDLIENSDVEFVVPPGEELVLMVVPDGSGPGFASARRLSDGAVTDGRIKLTLRDPWALPIANFPVEDLWLVTDDDGVVCCDVVICADGDVNVVDLSIFATMYGAECP